MGSLHRLLARRRQPKRFLLIAAAIPLAVVGLIGFEYGALIPYAVCAAIFILQVIYPTLLGWIFVVTIYSAASAIYLLATVHDLIELAYGRPASIYISIQLTMPYSASSSRLYWFSAPL